MCTYYIHRGLPCCKYLSYNVSHSAPVWTSAIPGASFNFMLSQINLCLQIQMKNEIGLIGDLESTEHRTGPWHRLPPYHGSFSDQ